MQGDFNFRFIMQADDFISFIKNLTPSYKDFDNSRWPKDHIPLLINEFKITKREQSSSIHSNEIVDLLSRYDLTEFSRQDISFDELENWESFTFFGYMDIFRLGIDNDSGTIVSYNYGCEMIDKLCADNSSKFLDALCELFSYSTLALLSSENDPAFNEDAVALAASKCAIIAGGPMYENFYRETFGLGMI